MSKLIYLIVLFGCSSPQKENRDLLKSCISFLEQKKITIYTEQEQSIFFINETGCIACIKSFSNLITNYVNNKSTAIIISVSSSSLDISAFLNDTAANIYFDDNNEFKKATGLESSSAIFIKNESIDTVITIDINNLEEKLEYINKRLAEK
jgi:hypothetical protein